MQSHTPALHPVFSASSPLNSDADFGSNIPKKIHKQPALQISLPVAVALFVALVAGFVVAYAGPTALLLVAMLIGVVLVLLDFRIGVFALVMLMPVSSSTMMPHSLGGVTGLNPLNVLILGTIVAALFQGIRFTDISALMPSRLRWSYILPMILASAWGMRFIHIIPEFDFVEYFPHWNTVTGYLIDILFKPLLIIAFGVLVGAAMINNEKPERLVYAMILSTCIMSLLCIGYALSANVSLAMLASASERSFFTPLGLHANDLGRFYAIAYALLLFSFSGARNPFLRLVMVGTSGLLLIALLLTFSRAAFISFAVINLIFLISRRKISLILAAMLIGSAALPFLPDAFYDRIFYGWGMGLDSISAGRVDGIWLPLLPEIAEHPFFGNGFGAILWSRAMLADSVMRVGHPHNAFLETVLNFGFVGLALIAAYLFDVWRGFHQLAKDPQVPPLLRGFFAGAAAALVGFLLAGMVGSRLTPCTEQIFLWLAIGMMYGYQLRLRQQQCEFIRQCMKEKSPC